MGLEAAGGALLGVSRVPGSLVSPQRLLPPPLLIGSGPLFHRTARLVDCSIVVPEQLERAFVDRCLVCTSMGRCRQVQALCSVVLQLKSNPPLGGEAGSI